MRVLFIEPYPTEGPSSRYRVEQYIPFLSDNNIVCMVRPFVSSKFYKILYKRGYYLEKILCFGLSCFRRFRDMLTALGCDIIFIHLEALPIGPPLLELFLAGIGKKIIYDLDDAIYLGRTSSANKFLRCLKWPLKIETIIRISKHVITCNEYLAAYALAFNKNVTVMHTSVDTDKFRPNRYSIADLSKNRRYSSIDEKGATIRYRNASDSDAVNIGWIGSHSTAGFLEGIQNVFYRLSRTHQFNLKIVGAGRRVEIPGVNIINTDWNLPDEINQFQSLDIGVYPLPDDRWTVGKTGFKTIQYMSVGIPCVVSNIGANKDIVENGRNGFLVDNEDEWVEKLSLLIENPDLRMKMGQCARLTAEERFSLKTSAPKYLYIIKAVAAGSN